MRIHALLQHSARDLFHQRLPMSALTTFSGCTQVIPGLFLSGLRVVELLADRKALLGHNEDVCPGFCGLGMLLTLYFTK